MISTTTDRSRVYVPVRVDFNEDGVMLPVEITWEDGYKYKIDKIIDISPSYVPKNGGLGDRYTIRIGKNMSYLYFESYPSPYGAKLGRWFVKRKDMC